MEFRMQPIGRSSVLEEIGESLVLPPVAMNIHLIGDLEVGRLAERESLEVEKQAERQAAQEATVGSGDEQIFLANEEAANRRGSSPPTSELSAGKLQARGWNKRFNGGRYILHLSAFCRPC